LKKIKGKKVRKLNLIGGLTWLGLSIIIGVESFRIGIGSFRSPDAGLFPFLTAILLCLLSLWLLSDTILGGTGQKKDDRQVWGEETRWKNLAFTVLALVLYALVVDKVGFLVTTFLFLLSLSRVIEPQRWPVAILGAMLTVFLSYAIFQVWLQSQLPDGVIISRLKDIF
jgi:putative tricarboxylic transport membrane protein